VNSSGLSKGALTSANAASTYYIFVASKTGDFGYSDLPFLSLMGVQAPPEEKTTAPQARTGGGSL
jgi:hypothetical protein